MGALDALFRQELERVLRRGHSVYFLAPLDDSSKYATCTECGLVVEIRLDLTMDGYVSQASGSMCEHDCDRDFGAFDYLRLQRSRAMNAAMVDYLHLTISERPWDEDEWLRVAEIARGIRDRKSLFSPPER